MDSTSGGTMLLAVMPLAFSFAAICRSGVWLPHIRLLIILHRLSALSVRPAQPRLRHISNKQRIRRPADWVTYTMSDDKARPSSFSCEMYACSGQRWLQWRYANVKQKVESDKKLVQPLLDRYSTEALAQPETL